MKIGFIGQGWIGKNMADYFEEKGHIVIRIDKEKKDKQLKDCEIVFIAVPTPTENERINLSILINAIDQTFPNQIVVIKSTIPPNTTEQLQNEFNDRFLIHSPEFLSEATAREDVDHPDRNILGYTDKSFASCHKVMEILPKAPYNSIIPAKEAEMIKYACNCFKYVKVVFFNLIYDFCEEKGINYNKVKEAVSNDKMIADWHLNVLHKGGRGAGGGCLIKDFSVLNQLIDSPIIKEIEKYNVKLLKESKKSLDLIKQIYG